jgi:hypothetical protein
MDSSEDGHLSAPGPDKISEGSSTPNTDVADISPSVNGSNNNVDCEKSLESPASVEEEGERRKLTGVKVSSDQRRIRQTTQADEFWQWFLFIISTLTSIFVYSLDNTIVADIVPVRTNPEIL